MNTKTITEKTIRALEDISNGYAPTPAHRHGGHGKNRCRRPRFS